MAYHPDITRKDDIALALDAANMAIVVASRQQTGPAGTITTHNADGSLTVSGPGAGSAGVAKWVGKTTAPGRPTGVTAESHMGCVFVSWDGSLEDGPDPSLGFVRLSIQYLGPVGDPITVDLADLPSAGSTSSVSLPVGTTVTVTAVSYDDAHDINGTPAPNSSMPSDPITVTVVDESVDMLAREQSDIAAVQGQVATIDGKAAAAFSAADAASAKADLVRSDAAADTQSVRDAAAKAQSDATAFGAVADKAAADINTANTRITTVSSKVDGLSTTISNTTDTANSALTLSTQNEQDLTGVSTTASSAYSDAQQSLTRVAAVEQTADSLTSSINGVSTTASSALSKATTAQQNLDGFKTSVASTYIDKQTAANTYATQSALSQTSTSLTSSINATTSTANSALSKANTLSQTVDALTSTVSAQATTLGGAVSNISSLQQTATSLSSSIGQTTNMAAQALANATELVIDGGFANGLDSWTPGVGNPQIYTADATYPHAVRIDFVTGNDNSNRYLSQSLTPRMGRAGTDRVLRVQFDLRVISWNTNNAGGMQIGFTFQTTQAGGWKEFTNNYLTGLDGAWRHCSADFTLPASADRLGMAMMSRSANANVSASFLVANVSVRDISEAAAAQSTAGTALSTAVTAQQNLDGFKATVQQTYDTTADATSRESVLTQNLNGFKTTVSQTYLDKTTATNTYPTKSDVSSQVSQTASDITSQVAAKYQTLSAMGGYPTTSSMTSAISQSKSDILSQVSGTYQTVSAMSGYPTLSAMNSAIQQSATGVKSDVSNMYVTTAAADGKYATQAALQTTDGKAVASNAAAQLALANARELVPDGSFANGLANWTAVKSANINTFLTTLNSVPYLALDPAPAAGQWALLCSTPIPDTGVSSTPRTLRLSFDAYSPWGGADTVFYASFRSGINMMIPMSAFGAKNTVQHFSQDMTLPANTRLDAALRFGIYTPGDAGIAIGAVSLRDVTEITALGDSIAATYVSNSSFQQKSDSLLGTVNGKYANNQSVTQRFGALELNDSSFSVTLGSKVDKSTADSTYLSQSAASGTYLKQTDASGKYATQAALATTSTTASTASSNASNAQNRVGALETCMMMTANGVQVGKISNGQFTGYSALVNANGSFDILDASSSLTARVDSNGLSIYDAGSNSMRPINRSVFNHDPIFMAATGSWNGGVNSGNNHGFTVNDFDSACVRIMFSTNWSTSVRVDIGAYLAAYVGTTGVTNGTTSLVIGYGFQVWRRNADGSNTLIQDVTPPKCVKCTNAVWEDTTQSTVGGSMSLSVPVTSLQSYTTYYIETRHVLMSSVAQNGSWNLNTSGHWACVTPLA
ncbi:MULTISPECIES: methyl-accepting chemotaxis protein [Bifidobacterium]|uniref:Methyl-accepting chemotaxis protein n=1 Tax=Bifidobacterium tibiigranuli TaxID=2172043 RepID=A0A5N6S788_9BIFI|nr:methyl-accepting chemotaxis protein [Bifidobacterium tibiigranuli]KAE8130206.1 methyl-accepting chemotaxis protein [Bifidobacterium tibiigranuli]KAE8130435.1 hypothetical protein DDF78_00545 [Bifidobacterium tibiigranuli]